MGRKTEAIRRVQEILKGTGINGCITGSSMLDADFDTWDEVPDVDVFVYDEAGLVNLADMLEYRYGLEPATPGEAWKLDRVRTRGMQRNVALSTVKLKDDQGIIVNVTWKKGKTTLSSVLSSFDMSIIMIGYDIKHGFGQDLRTGRSAGVFDDKDHLWSDDPMVAVPNPLRDQDVDMYGAEMWVRQFDRVIKYWNRGYDTRKMAEFYIKLITGVIENGKLFQSERADAAFSLFVDTYEPMRQKMIAWLDDKKEV